MNVQEIEVAVETAVLTEWQVLKKSDTVKGIVGMEAAAVSLFVEQMLDGKVSLTLESLKGWLFVQGLLVMFFLIRKAFAGIEVQIAATKSAEALDTAQRVQQKLQARVLKAIEVDHPEAAVKVREELAKPTPALAAA